MDDRTEGPHGGPPSPGTAPPAGRGQDAAARLRRYFLTGVVIAGPLTITATLVWWFVNLVDGWVKPVIPATYLPESYLPFAIPGFGLVVALFGLTMLGFLTANLVGRAMLEFGEGLLERTPVVSGLYRGMKQIFSTVFSTTGTTFRTVGLVEYPVKGTWSIVFLSKEAPPEVSGRLPGEDDHIGVFLPCSPNPTTGFFFYLPRKDVIEIAISVDEAAKLVMSAGLIQPDELTRRNRRASDPPAGLPAS
jgi:uncharacterized membrane protein